MTATKMGGLTIGIAANTSWYLQNFRGHLITSLIEAGYNVYTLAPDNQYVETLERLGATHFCFYLSNVSVNPLREAIALARITRTLTRLRPHLLLTYTPKVNLYCTLAARVSRIPVVANISGLGRAFAQGGPLQSTVRILYKVALKHASRVFFQNSSDHDQFIGAGIVSRQKSRRLPGSGVDLGKFNPRFRQRHTRDTFVFLLAARMLWEKGVGVFVEAARKVKAQMPQTEFRLYGMLEAHSRSGVPKKLLDEWGKEGTVRYFGSTDDMVPVYAEADCVVLPSFYREGVPRSLLEAASMGIPVITTRTPGCSDVVDDGETGLLCRAQDPDDLARAMIMMASRSPEDRNKMGIAGRRKMEQQFDERLVIQEYLATIAEVLQTQERFAAVTAP